MTTICLLLFYGGHGQIGAILTSHLAAGRYGRPDTRVSPHPCGDHGDCRRLLSLRVALISVRTTRRPRSGRRHRGRRRQRRCFAATRGSGSKRHQTGYCVLNVLASSAICSFAAGCWRLPSVGDVSSLHPRIFQSAAVLGRGLRHSCRAATNKTCATDGRPVPGMMPWTFVVHAWSSARSGDHGRRVAPFDYRASRDLSRKTPSSKSAYAVPIAPTGACMRLWMTVSSRRGDDVVLFVASSLHDIPWPQSAARPWTS